MVLQGFMKGGGSLRLSLPDQPKESRPFVARVEDARSFEDLLMDADSQDSSVGRAS